MASLLSHVFRRLALVVAISLAGCASTAPLLTSEPAASTAEDLGQVTYHDDNSDGVVDFEMHDFGCCDGNWALIDSDFDGTFDLRLQWGYQFTTEQIQQPVPNSVAISPEGSGWMRSCCSGLRACSDLGPRCRAGAWHWAHSACCSLCFSPLPIGCSRSSPAIWWPITGRGSTEPLEAVAAAPCTGTADAPVFRTGMDADVSCALLLAEPWPVIR